ncbi:mediator of RNA polymerase II transcription subunit 27-like, partial [Dermacentor silvarum]|uniref:mediator of RNA polymerase II transcription subunit 27-like n=1 Tax=Dermacentor silvarum TaxID=543639 RepID=UPI0021007F72
TAFLEDTQICSSASVVSLTVKERASASVRTSARLETAVTLLSSPIAPLNLGSTGHLCQDPTLDRTSLYTDMVKSYRWFDKVRKNLLFSQPMWLRIYQCKNSKALCLHQGTSGKNLGAVVAKKTGVAYGRGIIIGPLMKRGLCSRCLTLTETALVCLRGLIIEWVLVKAFNEDFYTDDDQLDMWSKFRYQVFQKVADHANAAMHHLFSLQLPDLAVESFLTWLHSYLHLFSAQHATNMEGPV